MIFLFVEGSGFVVKLVAAKVIRQLMFFFTYLISYVINFELKKDVIVLVHENPGTFSELVVIGAFCRGTIEEKKNLSTHVIFVSFSLLECKSII